MCIRLDVCVFNSVTNVKRFTHDLFTNPVQRVNEDCKSKLIFCVRICGIRKMSDKRTIYVGGLADDVTEKLINDAFIPFGDISDIQMPVDYESQKHRGFAFIEYETAEDAAAAIDNMVSEQFFF